MWTTVGFNLDHVVWLGVEGELRARVSELWRDLASPPAFQVRIQRQYGHFMVAWFVNPDAATALDQAGIAWRDYAGEAIAEPPPGASDMLRNERET
jgi:hypothetical protein